MSTEPTPNKKSRLKSFKFRIPKISFKTMNKNTVLAVSLLLVLIVVGIFTVFMTRDKKLEVASEESVTAQKTSDEKTITAVIKQQEGSFQIKPNEGDWKDAVTSDTLAEGYSIRTVGAVSRVIVAFEDGSELRIDANSEVSLETVRAERIVIKHVSGYTYNRVITSETLKYIVSSRDATYEAQGTAFKTAATGDEQAVEVIHSSVLETNLNKSPKAGQKLTVKNKVLPSSNGKIEQLDIEKVKSDAFLQWNRELDAKDDKFKKDLGFLQDIIPPEISLKSSDGDVIFLDPGATEGTLAISGNTEASAKLTALSKSQSGAQPVDVSVGSDGSFTTPVLSAPLGSSVFEFIVKDKTGNSTTKTLRVTFQRKSQPVIANDGSIQLTATKVGGDKVKFKWTYGSGTTAADGVKLIYSKTEDPEYKAVGTTTAKYYPTVTEDTLKYSDLGLTTGETYYFKVCIYDTASDACRPELYSTQVTVKP